MRAGAAPTEKWLSGTVEIRAIGHRLNDEGGKPLMRAVAERADTLSRSRGTLRTIDVWWNYIGEWKG